MKKIIEKLDVYLKDFSPLFLLYNDSPSCYRHRYLRDVYS